MLYCLGAVSHGRFRCYSVLSQQLRRVHAVCGCSTVHRKTEARNCGCSKLSTRRKQLLRAEPGLLVICYRDFHASPLVLDKEPSKVEQTVKALKEDLKVTEKSPVVITRKTLWRRVVDECKHYYSGFRLLVIDVGISSKFIWRLLNGEHLTRREYRQLVRTVADMFRLVPFSVFIIVPFMELLLPVALKLFPNMLPSTFQTENDKQVKMQKTLKVKLEMAKFLQNTLNEMAVDSQGGRRSEKAKEFMVFIEKIRQTGGKVSNEDILKFSKVFEDEITLDNLGREQLVALCRVLEMQPFGTNNFLRFQLRMRLRMLKADDKMLQSEGTENLTIWELQQACKARGMRAYGVSKRRLNSQLRQWLDLSLNHQVPPSLMLLSRTLYLPENLPAKYQLQATIQTLPEGVARQTKAAIAETEGKISNKSKLEVIQVEQEKIKEEKEELQKLLEEKKIEQVITPTETAQPITDSREDLIAEGERIAKKLDEHMPPEKPTPDIATVIDDTAPVISTKDIEEIEDALEQVGHANQTLLVEKEELKELKEESAEYQQDVKELKEISVANENPVRESKGAKRLHRKVNSLITQMDGMIGRLEKDKEQLQQHEEPTVEQKEELVSVTELLHSLAGIKGSTDETRDVLIAKVLEKLDDDHDGNVKVEDVLKVIELIGKEHVHISTKNMDEILDLLQKEEFLHELEKESKMEESEFGQEVNKDPSANPGNIMQPVLPQKQENKHNQVRT